MDIDKHVEMLGENIDEILTSTAAVKGEAFAEAVAINFEAIQAMSIVGMLTAVADEKSKELASKLHEACLNILASIAAKVCGDMSDDDVKEVMRISSALNKRRNEAGAEILKGMGDAD